LCFVVAAGIATVAGGRPMPASRVAAGPQPPAQAPARPAAIGRWDLTVQGPKGPYPSWLEVTLSGTRTLVGRFVGGGGSARPISRIDVSEGSIHFAIPPQWEKETNDLVFDAAVTGDTLEGTLVTPGGERQRVAGRRAPSLRRAGPPSWGQTVPLFNGQDLAGWTTFGGTSQWTAENGVLKNARSGANLVTTAKYDDFKLHLEVNCPKGSNSGIYLRGRYEVQVEDAIDPEPKSTDLGGIYGFLVPNENASAGAGNWQTFDITLVGRRVTVVLNGKTIIGDQTIPGITGGALDSDEGAPGPIYLQGDHGAVAYRNLRITPAEPAK
ncbi:MAG: DUF1080 domain-containing protein, partial [Rhodospirillaceae bacterium]